MRVVSPKYHSDNADTQRFCGECCKCAPQLILSDRVYKYYDWKKIML